MRHYSEFAEVLKQIAAADSKEALAGISGVWKQMKNAFAELVTTNKSSNKRLAAALELALKKVEETKSEAYVRNSIIKEVEIGEDGRSSNVGCLPRDLQGSANDPIQE